MENYKPIPKSYQIDDPGEKKFNPGSLILERNSLSLQYQPKSDISKNVKKIGQLKLLMSEINFLTYFWDPKKYPNPLLVYAGAMEGYHIKHLALMFPAFEFHLYDKPEGSRDFMVPEMKNITIFRKLFEEKEVKKYSDKKYQKSGLFFVSDIRSSGLESEKRKLAEELKKDVLEQEEINLSNRRHGEAIWRDMLLQESWVKKINPTQSLLKFRFPFDIEENYDYLNGIVFLQQYSGPTSTETRLVPIRDEEGNYMIRNWNAIDYENMLFYHNKIVRSQNQISDLGKNTYDFTASAFILQKYSEKVNFDSKLIPIEKFIYDFFEEMRISLYSPEVNLENFNDIERETIIRKFESK